MVFLFIFIIIILSFIFSKIKIEIINFEYNSSNKQQEKIDYKIIIKFCLFNKIQIIKMILTQDKLEKLKVRQKVKDIVIKALINKGKIDIKISNSIQKIKISIKRLSLKIDIGTYNAAFTAIIVGVISAITSIILRNKVENYRNQKFKINPIYTNQNVINIALSGIFEVKMIHIINIIYILNKKERVKKYERTSNRRFYAYSYE